MDLNHIVEFSYSINFKWLYISIITLILFLIYHYIIRFLAGIYLKYKYKNELREIVITLISDKCLEIINKPDSEPFLLYSLNYSIGEDIMHKIDKSYYFEAVFNDTDFIESAYMEYVVIGAKLPFLLFKTDVRFVIEDIIIVNESIATVREMRMDSILDN